MSAVTKRQLRLLDPYLVGEGPTQRGEDGHEEWDMYCPLHNDSQRSAGIHLQAGVWNCQAGCGGGRVSDLVKRRSEWVDPPSLRSSASGSQGRGRKTRGNVVELSEEIVDMWIKSLYTDEDRMDSLISARGLVRDTILKYEIGYDRSQDAYTIPIRNEMGELVNVRWYSLNPPEGRRKIWSANGHGAPVLYPIDVLGSNPSSIVICEGEWDALLSIQNGVPAITRTGAATVWKSEWSDWFRGRNVFLCHDMDATGQDANRKIAKILSRAAKSVRVIHLPYEVTDNHGKDLTDFWKEHSKSDFLDLIRDEQPEQKEVRDVDPYDASVLDSFDARNVGEPLRLTVTIKGKRSPGYSVPSRTSVSCTRDAGEKCSSCPLNAARGEDEILIESSDPLVLDMLDVPRTKMLDALRESYGAHRCVKLRFDIQEWQSVETLFARPSVEHSGGSSEGYSSMKITSAGRHDTPTNNTVRVVGALYPDPKQQQNEFLAWEVQPIETTLDRFSNSELDKKLMKRFRPRKGQRPLKKLGEISRELSSHVTSIYGRPEMHAMMDLTWHSVISFELDGKLIDRGWMDTIVVGDTRTGKSEAAVKLAAHYRAGEIVSCESASFAGIIGGLQQYGASKEWAINWGAIPINDRRLVVLDEVSGLKTDEIGSMSSVRSSGVAELTKIQQDRTHARTRLIWLGNPRDARMSDYTYGVQALKPLIGNAEDIARFDMAMSVRAGEVSPDEINRSHVTGELRYTSEACATLIRWVWSRTAEDVVWDDGATEAVYECAKDMGSRYIEEPPLVQVANIRVKLARAAVALAARLYSTDDSGEKVIVKKEHVEDAMRFFDIVYGMESFGYAERSREAIQDREDAERAADDMKVYITNLQGLAKFLRVNSSFRRQDLEEVLNVSREEANGVITQLLQSRMVRKDKGDVRIEPTLHNLLRELR